MNSSEKNEAQDNLIAAALNAEGMLRNLRKQASAVLVQRALDELLSAIQAYKKIK